MVSRCQGAGIALLFITSRAQLVQGGFRTLYISRAAPVLAFGGVSITPAHSCKTPLCPASTKLLTFHTNFSIYPEKCPWW